MTNTNEVVHYFRSNKPIAVIYVRGDKKEMQEMLCNLCAVERGYNVAFTTDNIDDVKDCNVLLTMNPSRINRDKIKYHEIVKGLKMKGIKVEFASEHENIMEHISFFGEMLAEKYKKE